MSQSFMHMHMHVKRCHSLMFGCLLINIFLLRKKGHDIFQPWSVTVFGCVLLADISGFTKLANKLDIESLKFHIK